MKTLSICSLARVPFFGACVFVASCQPDDNRVAASKETVGPVAATVDDALLVLPGDYAQSTTLTDLEARFGAGNVRRETAPEPRVVLFPDDPSRRAYVTFHEAADFKELARISVTDPGSRWRGKHGVRVGMTMATLRELNGKPFYYQGFDDQGRGYVRDSWSPSLGDDDSTLGAFDVSEGEHLYFDIDLGVVRERGQADDPTLPVDDRVSSDDPRFPRLGDRVIVTGISASSSLDDEWE